MRSTMAARCLAALLAGVLVAGCGTASTPAPSPSAPGTPGGTVPAATPAASLAAAHADTLRVGWDPGPGWALYGFRGALEGQDWHQLSVGTVVLGGLYRYDASFEAVPDLADGPCLPQADPTVIRCRLIEATFHDGTPVTADDVAYSYRLYSQPTFSGGNNAPSAWFTGLDEVRVVDDRTVDFDLATVDPAFLATGLTTPILPRHAVEASYASFAAATKGLRSADLVKLADDIDAGMSEDPPACGTHVDEAASLLDRMGVLLYREDFSRDGTFDVCGWVGVAGWLIRMAAASLDATGLAAVAAAYADLSVDWRPVGTGPYRFVSEDADGIHVEAWPAYHGGMAATRFIDFVPAKGDGSDLLDGSLDLYQIGDLSSLTNLGARFDATAASNGLRISTLPQSGYYALQYNARPGRLFADVDLRRALQLCVDLPRVVDAATGGAGSPTYGPVMPGTWAYDPTIPKPARDVAAARALIEGTGWAQGADGVYVKDGARLAATIPVRGDAPDRVKMADLIVSQARDCGMDLQSRPTGWFQLVDGLFPYPHLVPGTDAPFDLYLGGWVTDPGDPDADLQGFVSANATDAEHPVGTGGPSHEGADWTGFSDPALDALVNTAMSTYDQAERVRLYRAAQQEIAAQQPYLFLWAANAYDVVSSRIATVDGPLDLSTPNWAWQPERLVVTAEVR